MPRRSWRCNSERKDGAAVLAVVSGHGVRAPGRRCRESIRFRNNRGRARHLGDSQVLYRLSATEGWAFGVAPVES